MSWVEKAEKLIGKQDYADIEQQAGWKPNTLSNTLRRGSIPRADKAIQLAKVLRVPAEWLFDDEQTGPPPTSFGERVGELSPSMRKMVLEVLGSAIDQALAQSVEAQKQWARLDETRKGPRR